MNSANEPKTCFIIMPISDVDGYQKGHFNRIYEHIIKPACEKNGLRPLRADDTSKTNVIIIDILQKILDSDIAVCDLSACNPNVFYELGFRQAFNKKTVLIKDKRTSAPFDITSLRYLVYDESLRIDLVENAVESLFKTLKETLQAEDTDVNSLFQLLNLNIPAQLPEKINITNDTSLILKAIHDLSSVVQYHPKDDIYISEIDLEGDKVHIGTELYDGKGTKLGTIVLISSTGDFTIMSSNGTLFRVNKDDQLYNQLSPYPF